METCGKSGGAEVWRLNSDPLPSCNARQIHSIPAFVKTSLHLRAKATADWTRRLQLPPSDQRHNQTEEESPAAVDTAASGAKTLARVRRGDLRAHASGRAHRQVSCTLFGSAVVDEIGSRTAQPVAEPVAHLWSVLACGHCAAGRTAKHRHTLLVRHSSALHAPPHHPGAKVLQLGFCTPAHKARHRAARIRARKRGLGTSQSRTAGRVTEAVRETGSTLGLGRLPRGFAEALEEAQRPRLPAASAAQGST